MPIITDIKRTIKAVVFHFENMVNLDYLIFSILSITVAFCISVVPAAELELSMLISLMHQVGC